MSPHPPGSGLGGLARVGWGSRRGSDLFAVTRDSLVLRCLGTYRFAPAQIVAVERLGASWFDGGVRIVHNRRDCPRSMSFYCRGGSDEVLRQMAAAGFVPCGTGPAGRSPWPIVLRIIVVMMVLDAIASILFRVLR